jgi:hypothetical protein
MRGRNPSADSAAGPGRERLDPLSASATHHNLGRHQSAKSRGGWGACVREDLMDLLIERNQLG